LLSVTVGQAQLQHTLIGHRWTVSCLSFHPAARMLASGSFDRTIRIWDTNDGKVRACLVLAATLSSRAPARPA